MQQLGGALFDAVLQGGVERFQRRQGFTRLGMGLDPLDMRPGALGHFADQRLLVGGPHPRHIVVDRHQRGQLSALDQRHANGGGDADGLEGGRFFGGQLGQVVIDHQRQATAQAAERQVAECGQPILTDQARRAERDGVTADGETVFVGVHHGIGAAGQLQVLDQPARGDAEDMVRIGGIGHRATEIVEKFKALVGDNAGGGFGDRVEHADDAAVLIADRAVAEGEVGQFGAVVAVDDQREVLDIDRFARQCAVGHAADVGPGFLPHFAEGAAKGQGLVAEDLRERIVVQRDKIGSPEDRLGKA
ncbi:hypothetical protein D3C79_673710 [compost metagenome]